MYVMPCSVLYCPLNNGSSLSLSLYIEVPLCLVTGYLMKRCTVTLFGCALWMATGCHLNLSLECVLLENCNFIDSGKGSVSVNNKINAKLSGFGISKLFREFHDESRNVKRTSFTCFKGACPSLVDDVHFRCFSTSKM